MREPVTAVEPSSRPASLAGTPAATPLGYVSWAAAQGARDPYYIMVVIYIFYPYFSNVVVGDPVRGQSLLGYTNAINGAILATLAPVLGAIADKTGRRKPWVMSTVALMAAGAFCLWYAKPGGAGLGIYPTLTLLISIGVVFTISEVFHNAMLASVAPYHRVGLISGLAFAFGNVGGLLLMIFVLVAFSLPGDSAWSFVPTEPWLGLDKASHEHDRAVGPIAAIWMLLLTAPMVLFTPDGERATTSMGQAIRSGLAELRDTLSALRNYGNIALYLLARMFYFDGMVGVMTFGGVYASGTFGWDTTALLIFGLCTSFSAMVGAYFGGIVDDALGSKRALTTAITMSAVILCVLVSVRPGEILFVFDGLSNDPVWSFPYFQTLPELVYFFYKSDICDVFRNRIVVIEDAAHAPRSPTENHPVFWTVRSVRHGDRVPRAVNGGPVYRHFRKPARRVRVTDAADGDRPHTVTARARTGTGTGAPRVTANLNDAPLNSPGVYGNQRIAI